MDNELENNLKKKLNQLEIMKESFDDMSIDDYENKEQYDYSWLMKVDEIYILEDEICEIESELRESS